MSALAIMHSLRARDWADMMKEAKGVYRYRCSCFTLRKSCRWC
jgi:hypothetical protein